MRTKFDKLNDVKGAEKLPRCLNKPMKTDKVQVIKSWLEQHIVGTELFIFEIKYNPAVNKVTVYIDSDNGVTIDACAKLSRAIEQYIDENNVLGEKYGLDVSSPGIDQPLHERQYKRNIGRDLLVTTHANESIKGTLKEVTEMDITLSYEIKNATTKKKEIIQRKINKVDIVKALVQLKF